MPRRREGEKPSRRLFGLRLDERLVIDLRHVALDQKRPANQLFEEAIEDWLKRHSPKRQQKS